MNASFEEIATLLRGQQDSVLYCYVVRSVGTENGTMVQKGSGPNFQGDFITLCTCKRLMRTFRSANDWRNVWIVGMAGSEAKVNHGVFYMMKVLAAFESYQELSNSDVLPQKTKRAKAAEAHRLGDIYKPIDEYEDPFDPDAYVRPVENHSHAPDDWRNDINYRNARTGYRAALLVGDPEFSFLWEVPTVFPRFNLLRGQKKIGLNEFETHFERG